MSIKKRCYNNPLSLLLICLLFISSQAICQIPGGGGLKQLNISPFKRPDPSDKIKLNPLKAGNLGLAIMASTKPDFLKEWLTAPPEKVVEIENIKWIKHEETLYVGFFVTGLFYGINSSYDYKVSFYVIGPDGKAKFGQRNYAGGQGKHPEKPSIYLADPALELTFAKDDPDGMYVIVARVEDQTNGKTFKNTYPFYVSDEKPADIPSNTNKTTD